MEIERRDDVRIGRFGGHGSDQTFVISFTSHVVVAKESGIIGEERQEKRNLRVGGLFLDGFNEALGFILGTLLVHFLGSFGLLLIDLVFHCIDT